MSNSLQYTIANLHIAFQCNSLLEDNASWQIFAAKCPSPADFTYDCRLLPQLPDIPEGGNVCHYYDYVKQRYYSITEDLGSKMIIYLTEADLPWCMKLDQLYTQLALSHVLLLKNRLLLHASYILTEGGAVLFTAPSGTGKSTQAELWKQHRKAFIVNGDRGVIGLEANIPTAYGFPLSGSSQDCHNRTARLRAVVSLKQAPQNSVRRLHGTECVRVLVNGTYLPEEYLQDLPQAIETAMMIAREVPILELACLPNESAVIALEYALQHIENEEKSCR